MSSLSTLLSDDGIDKIVHVLMRNIGFDVTSNNIKTVRDEFVCSLRVSVTTSLNKVEAFTIRQASKKVLRHIASIENGEAKQMHFNQCKKRLVKHSTVDINRFIYVISHIIEDKAVHDLVRDTSSSHTFMSQTNAVSVAASESSEAITIAPSKSSIVDEFNVSITTRDIENVLPLTSSSSSSIHTNTIKNSSPIHSLRTTDSFTYEGTSQALSPHTHRTLSSIKTHTSIADFDAGGKIGNELIVMSFGSEVSLRSLFGQYANIEEGGLFVCNSPSPSPFVIVNADNRRDNSTMRFGDVISLCLRDGSFIEANTDGIVSVTNTNVDSRSKWTLTPIDNQSSMSRRRCILIGDKIALKSCFGTFVHADVDGSTHVNAAKIKDETTWLISNLALPFVPEWARHRALHLIAQQQPVPLTNSARLSQYPRSSQELALLEAVLSSLMGCGGQWIYKANTSESQKGVCSGETFRLNEDLELEVSLHIIVSRLLPLCNAAEAIRVFVDVYSRYEYGLVHHALSASIHRVLKDLMVRVAQLEHELREGELTLQRAWLYLQSSLKTLDVTHKLLGTAATVKGGALIQCLYDLWSGEGDGASRQLYCSYLEHACVPYFHMLERWIYHGEIHDPYDEFQIKVRSDLRKENLEQDFNDQYWNECYTIRQPHVPSFLRASSERILATGKNLNVIRQCARSVNNPHEKPFEFTTDVNIYHERINHAFSFASRTLLGVLLDENKLIPRLRSIKRYFLLDHGDFIVHFMDSVEEELRKNVGDIVSSKLESLLELSIRTSSGANLDPFKDDLTCYLQQYTLIQKLEAIHNMSDQHYLDNLRRLGRVATVTSPRPSLTVNGLPFTGLEAFTLDYCVRWPLTLVLSKKALTKYQLIFRHLFYIKHVERQICTTWLEQQSNRELSIGSVFAQSYALRQRMLHFLQNLLFYLMVEVLEPKWHILEAKIREADAFDEVLHTHDTFLDSCLKECLLTNHSVLKTLTKLLSTCVAFSDNMKRFAETLSPSAATDCSDEMHDSSSYKSLPDPSAQRRARIYAASEHARTCASDPHFASMINEYGSAFDQRLRTFMQQLMQRASGEYHSHMFQLCTRLDYNQFYAKQNMGGDVVNNLSPCEFGCIDY